MRHFSLAVSIVGIAAIIFACEDEHSHASDEFPACKEIIDACHELDTGAGFAHECHEVAHDAKEEATCAAKRAECLAGCVATDGGGAADAATDG